MAIQCILFNNLLLTIEFPKIYCSSIGMLIASCVALAACRVSTRTGVLYVQRKINMIHDVNLWPLIGVAVIIAGFILRFNPMLVVIITAIVTAFAAGFPIDKILATIGTGRNWRTVRKLFELSAGLT